MDYKKFLFLIFILCGCGKDAIESSERRLADQLAGTWELEGAVHDGYLMEEWEGLSLSFEKSGSVQGVYEMPLSPNDSIWSKAGSWFVEGEFTFIKDDVESVTVLPDPTGSGSLFLSFERPSTLNPEDLCTIDTVTNDTICIFPIIDGYWSFLLSKVE